MIQPRTSFGVLACGLMAATLAACSGPRAQHSAQGGDRSQATGSPARVSGEACDKPIHLKLKRTAGSFTLPSCDGFSIRVEYPAVQSRAARSITAEVGADNFNNVPPPSNYGTPMLWISYTSYEYVGKSQIERITFKHALTPDWNHGRTYVYSIFSDGNGPTGEQSMGIITCKATSCTASTSSPLLLPTSADERIDLQVIKDPGLVNR